MTLVAVCLLALLFASQCLASEQQSACAVCELVVQVAENYVASNATLQQIEAKAQALCNDLPSPYNGVCSNVVANNLPQIVAWLQNNEPPQTICTQLQLCASSEKQVAEKKRTVEQSPCAVCELVVQVAESYIANNATDAQIEAKLDAVCGDLPSPYNGECTLIVNAYLPQIISWIQNNESPATLCAQLSLCSSKISEVAPIKRAVEQSPCAICELVVQVVESYVANNATDQQIEAKLDALCAKLPSPYGSQCALIVNTYLPQIISYIQNDESPATVCAQLSLCSSKPAPVKRDVEQSICAVCELVVQVAENYVENNATLAQIEAKLDAVCGDLPTPYNGECTLIVNSYLPQIVTWLQNDEPPATLCGQLSLCTSKKS